MSTTTIPAHLAHLPVFDGLPVPWVAIWEAEQRLVAKWWPGSDGVIPGRWTERRLGMLWVAVPNLQGGRPVFSMTHSQRQRRCMLGPRCQVCGVKIDGTPNWLIPDIPDHRSMWDGTSETSEGRSHLAVSPPVCDRCAHTAHDWCPHLRRRPPIVARGHATPAFAMGDAFIPATREIVPRAGCAIGDPATRWMIGRQLVMEVNPE